MPLTLAVGLAAVPFFNQLAQKRQVIFVELPKVASTTPLYIIPTEALTPEALREREIRSRPRDLAAYDFSGDITDCSNQRFRLLSEFQQCRREMSESRDFILKHWQAKKRGYINLEWGDSEAETNFEVFIEPDEKGVWHILFFWENYGTSSNKELRHQEFSQLKRKRAARNDPDFDSGTYYLSFLDQDHQEIKRW